MSIHLPLDQMTLADKLEVMETLWADLSRSPADLPSPDWHRDVLQDRKHLVAEGQLKFLDWETAIAELRNEVRGNTPT
ncbi:MAG: addiction module protein [Planctomycetota bacterium]|nr:addiction module protein [Planctomycetota bacterium]